MQTARSTPPLIIQPKVSLFLVGSVSLIHLGAMLSIAIMAMLLMARVSLIFLLGIHLLVVLCRMPGMPFTFSITTLRWLSDGSWQFENNAGEVCDAQLLPSSTVTPWLVILNFHITGRWTKWPGSVALCRDAVDEDTLRRLKVRLKTDTCPLPDT